MGCWSVYCGISKITIREGDDFVIIPIRKNTSGRSYFKWLPATLPIFGKYNDYGGMEEIVQDENTKLIEEHFGITIDEFVVFLLDGKRTYDRDEATEVEEKMKNLDEAKDWNFMFVERGVYDFMSTFSGEPGHLEFGDKGVLELIGFEYVGLGEDPRYKHVWKFGDKLFESDGTWMHDVATKQGVYCFDTGYSKLSDLIEIPEDKKWIGTKTMAQLWEHLPDKTAKKFLLYGIGLDYHDLEDSRERILEILKANNPDMDLSEFETPEAKTLEEKYKRDFRTHGKLLCDLTSISSNFHPMSGTYEPYILYLTPQCGEHRTHQKMLEKFAEINKSRLRDDEDDE